MFPNDDVLRWYESHHRFIAAEKLPALMLDLLKNRGFNEHYLLRKTGIFYEDILHGNLKLSPTQLAQLCLNTSQIDSANEISFLSGQRLLPGTAGPISTAIQYAPDLQHLLNDLSRYSRVFFPLLEIRYLESEKHAYLFFEDSYGCLGRKGESGRQLRRFLLEQLISAIVSFSAWLSRRQLPWQIQLAYSEPKNTDAYRAYLVDELSFNASFSCMMIPLKALSEPWPGGAETIYQMSVREIHELAQSQGDEFSSLLPPTGFLGLIAAMLRKDIQNLPSLEAIAGRLNISIATLKRKLKHHHSSYQLMCDRVRMREALYLKEVLNLKDNEVAERLNYYDVSNFRRSLKRWLSKGGE